jgi:hypothetical protein
MWCAGALWKVRNKMTIEKKMVKSPNVIIFNILSFMQQWSALLATRDQELVSEAARRIREQLVKLSKDKG